MCRPSSLTPLSRSEGMTPTFTSHNKRSMSPAPKHSRRWFQFSLGTMFAITIGTILQVKGTTYVHAK